MRKMLLKGLMVVAAMLVCLSASAIDKVIKSTGLDNEVTSLEELKSQKVILQNADGKMLYIPGVGGESSWDFKMTDLVNGLSSNNGAFLSAIDYDGHLIFQVFNLNGDERATPSWAGGKAYLNSQPEGGNVIFGLAGMNDQHGQDGKNLAVWDVEYVEEQGFSFHNVGRDIYLGYDATDARPSTSVVYWKAFTAYHAGYVQTEVKAAYEQAIAAARTTETIAALEAAKSAFDSSADLNAFGDAVNAAIDVVNACQAINTKYANLDLDEAGAAVAADVLAKYENKEYANIAELRAAYILAAKAQTTAGANMTGAIVNPEINGADGWTILKPLGGNGPLKPSNDALEYWAGNASDRAQASFDYYQVISGLVNGAYTVTADMYNSLNGEEGATWNATSGVYGKGANESVTLVNEEGMTLKPYTTGQVFVVDGTIRIGVKNTVTPMAARWFVADNFKLTYLGETPEYAEATKPYAIAIAEGIENGTVAADVETAEEGATVTLTATPAEGYKLEAITVTAGEASVEVTEAEGTYTFVMPAAAVTVSATFVAEAVVPEPVLVYTDLAVEDYYTWSAADATGEKVNQCPTTLVLNESTGLPFGDGNVHYLNYVDLSDAVNMVVTATDGTPRMLFNRVEDNGTVNVELPLHAAEYWTEVDNGDGSKTYTVDVKKIVAKFGFAHLHCIKGANWANTTITSVKIGQHKVSSNIPGITVTADKKWATYISQVDRSIPSGLRAFTCDGIGAKNALELTEIHISIPANTPCILYNTTADNITIDRNFGDIKAEKDSYKVGLLTGVYRKTYVPAGSYILQRKGEDTGFFICDQDNTITVARNRCYLTVDAVNAPAAAPSRSFIFNEPGTTGIPSVQGSISKMMNGSDIYDAQGRKLKSMQKGINIINGVKVRIK